MAAPLESGGSVIQSLWLGPRLSTLEQLSINSFIANGHTFHLYTYDELQGVPSRAILCDASPILPRPASLQVTEHNSCAGFADVFRYKLLFERGGWWSDLDIVCLKPFAFDSQYVFASEHKPDGRAAIQSLSSTGVTNCVIKAPQSCAILEYAVSVCRAKHNRPLKWGEFGPDLLNAAVEKFGLHSYVKNPMTFCPIPYFRFHDVILPRKELQFASETYGIHLWNDVWRRFNADKDEEYAPQCIYERLKRMYLDARSMDATA
jgi:hypothetical protein